MEYGDDNCNVNGISRGAAEDCDSSRAWAMQVGRAKGPIERSSGFMCRRLLLCASRGGAEDGEPAEIGNCSRVRVRDLSATSSKMSG